MNGIQSDLFFDLQRKMMQNAYNQLSPVLNITSPIEDFEFAYDELAKLMEANKDKIKPVIWSILFQGLSEELRRVYGKENW